MASSQSKNSALFVCLGNICRSTMAEGIFEHLLVTRGIRDQWLVDSAGTGDWHVGSPPDKRTMDVLKKNGITSYKHRGRLITSKDFTDFKYIFGMDDENMRNIKALMPSNGTAELILLGTCDPQKIRIIEDPYFTHSHNKNAFNEVYEQCLRCCTAFLDSVQGK